MRVTALLTAALVLAACGGKTSDGGSTPPPPADGGAMSGVAPTGATHVVEMIDSKFEPITLTIKSGESVEFKNISGGLHNIVFIADSIPPGAAEALSAGIPDRADDLSTAMIPEGSSVIVSFANAPAGEYRILCLPHDATGMRGAIIVEP